MIRADLDRETSVLHIAPQAPLEESDFERLTQLVDPYIEATGGLAALIIEAPHFPGWKNLGAMIRHFKFVRDHHKKISKVALVTDASLGSLAEKIGGHFVAAQIRQFKSHDLDSANDWITDNPI